MAAEIHIGDRVQAGFKNGEGLTTAKFVGTVTDFDYGETVQGDESASRAPKAQVQCDGFLAWVDLSVLKPA